MANPFAITVATNTVSLDNNRQGGTSFTVSNTTTQPLRGRGHVVAQSATAEGWLKLVGDAERDIASQGSQQYVVQIAVPPNAPAGEYSFRLDIVDVADPDDNFSEGPTVQFSVPTAAPKPKPFPWWIVAVVIAALLLIGGAVYGIVHAVQTTSPTVSATTPTTAPPTPSPTPKPLFTTGTWKGQIPSAAHPQQTLQVNTFQQSAFTGNLAEACPYTGEGNRSDEFTINGNAGSLNQFGTAAQNRLQQAIAQYGNGSQTYLEFTITAEFAIACGQPEFSPGTTFDAVVYPDWSLHGFWFNPGDTSPDGTFILNKA